MNSSKKIILGSSYYSVGYAFEANNTMIIERTQLCDPVYYGTFRTFKIEYRESWLPETKELFSFFTENGGIKDGYLIPTHSEILLADFIRRKEISMLFGSDIIEHSKKTLSIINNGGINHLEAEKIIDKRTKSCGKKHINVICTGKPSNIEKNENFEISTSFFPCENRFVLTFSSSEETETNLLKMLITDHLTKSFKNKDDKILRMAYLPYFDDSLPCPFDEFDKGIKDGREAKK
ncbi:MAG: hypothetical protein IKK94_01795 [Clostridia bacterium]|nr:hypothetical protein [Clostridia bacterium]